MIVFDAPPAIIIPRPAPEFRLYVNNEDAGHAIPRDFLAMPPVLRLTVSPGEIRKWLPEPYRMLGDGMMLSMFGGWPGPLMAGGIKTGWLFDASGTFTIPGDWNREDNTVHGVGRGGNGASAVESPTFPSEFYGGGGGGGGGYSAIINRALDVGDQFAVTIGGDTSFGALMIARAGGNAGPVQSQQSNGGQGGQASSGVGDLRTSGGNGMTRSGLNWGGQVGGGGGGAGGPNGNGVSAGFDGGAADAGLGGASGKMAGYDYGPIMGQDGIYGPSGGWAPGIEQNVGSGGGGPAGYGNVTAGPSSAWKFGGTGGAYGGGAGGGGAIGALSSQAAAREQAAATRYAADIQRQNYQDQMKALQPAIQAGNTAREYQLGALGLPGGQGYDAAMDAFRTSPGYDFAMRSGINNAQTSAAAGGRLFSGSTLKALSDRAQGMADQEYGTWYNRLSGLSGAGQAATGQGVGLGTATANNLSQLAVQGGDNQASSFIRGANAITGGIQNLADQYAYYNPPRPGGMATGGLY